MARSRQDRAFLDHLEAYLSRRDGVDKLLKITRYTAKILLASHLLSSSSSSSPSPSSSAISARLKDFESSVGTSRKAFRLGKFVQDINSLRSAPPLFSSRDGFLELIASGGEGIYYFVEQFIWLTKSGLLDKRHQKRLQTVSAWAEFIGYFGSITLKSLQIRAMLAKESNLLIALKKREDIDEPSVERMVSEIRQKRAMKILSVIQDLSDTLLALSDIRDGNGILSNPLLLSSCGLLSALISTHKNWLAC